MKKQFSRKDRIADLIQQSLAQLLIHETADARFRLVTVTGVEVSRDLSYAKVYVSVLAEEETEITAIVKALNIASKMLRFHLAKAVKLRVVPELRFHFDSAALNGFRISSLINDAMKNTGKEE